MFIAIKQPCAVDPNKDKVAKALNLVGGNHNALNWTHLKPVKVKKNTDTHYIAKYRDNHGSYWFEIRKNADGSYGVCSDGVFAFFGDRERIVWEFENQINNNPIKCL